MDDVNQLNSNCGMLRRNFSGIKEKFIVNFNKEPIAKETKHSCKVLKLSSKLNLDGISSDIDKLQHEEFPNVSMFIIEAPNAVLQDKLKASLNMFFNSSSIVVEIISIAENTSEIYYREKKSKKFTKIKHNNESFEAALNFSSFLCSFKCENIEILESIVINNLNKIQNFSLIMRFLDASYEDGEGFSTKLAEKVENILMNSTTSTTFESIAPSVQELQLKHRVRISTTIYKRGSYSILCQLLKEQDFPFPENFDPNKSTQLKEICNDREKFHEAVKAEDKKEIEIFHNSYPKLKIGYSFENNSAYYQSVHLKKNNAFLKLKSLGFRTSPDENDNSYKLEITIHELKLINEENTQQALSHSEISLLSMKIKSKIHDNIHKHRDSEYQGIYEQWFDDILESKYGQLLLDVVATCDILNIFFNFDHEYTDNMKLDDQTGIAGHTYFKNGRIYIGALLKSKGICRKQTLRAYLAHELCHYAMHLVYENSMLPYYENSKHSAEYKAIQEEIQKRMLENKAQNIDDGCDEIISSIYDLYGKDKSKSNEIIFEIELIVRVIQIYVYYMDDVDKIRELEEVKYKRLFDYFKKYVVKDMEDFLQNKTYKIRNDVRELNKMSGLLQNIKDMKYELAELKPTEVIGSGNIIILTSNQPKLVLQNAYKKWDKNGLNLFDTANIVVNGYFVNDANKSERYNEVLNRYNNLTIYIDCSDGLAVGKIKFLQNKDKHRFIFLMLRQEIESYLRFRVSNFNLNSENLTNDGQDLMRKTNIEVSVNSNCSVYDMLSANISHYQSEVTKCTEKIIPEILKDVPEIVDDQVLRWLVKTSGITETYKGSDQNFITAVRNEKCFIITDYKEKDKEQSWMIKKIVNPQLQTNASRWATFADLSLIVNTIKFDSEFRMDIHRNDKVLFLIDGFDEVAPKDSTFLSKVNYDWTSLTENGQLSIVKIKIFFQNESLSFFDMLKETFNPAGKLIKKIDKAILPDFSEIVDDRLLYLLMEPTPLKISTKLEGESKDKYYNLLFQTREFIENRMESSHIKINWNCFLKNTIQKSKYVVIYDMAGSGKSWMMKSMADILRKTYKKSWVTYVDLKQFIKVFKNLKQKILKFDSFMVDKILDQRNKFELKMFKKFYELGKVFVLFDGFDEIAPAYAKIVTDLVKSFQSNGKNQLWIATRDYVEADLQKKLKIKTTYRLNDFKEEDGIKLIAYKWVINDFKEHETRNFTINYIENYESYQDYKDIAKSLIEKVLKSSFRQIGIVQLFSVFADGYDKNTISIGEISIYNIFENASNKYIKVWYEAGELREKKLIETFDIDMNFNRLHEFLAMQSYFPEKKSFCGLDNNNCKWTDEHINDCGIIHKNGDYAYFMHETFREYYAAKFVVIILIKKSDDHEVYEYLVNFLTQKKFRIVRSFLDAALSEHNFLNDQNGVQKIANVMKESDDFSLIFEENHEYLINIFISILYKLDYVKMHNCLNSCIQNIIKKSENCKIYEKIQDFFLENLELDDLKIFILEKLIFHEVIKSRFDCDIFEKLVTATVIKTDQFFLKKVLMTPLTCIKNFTQNIIRSLLMSNNQSREKVRNFFEILKEFLEISEIIELFKTCLNTQCDILEYQIHKVDKEGLKIIWEEIQVFFELDNSSQTFKNYITQRKNNIINTVAGFNSKGLHKTFFELLKETFEPEEAKTLIINGFERKFEVYNLCKLIVNLKQLFYSYFTKYQLQEILNIKNRNGSNLLQIAAKECDDVKSFNLFWEIVDNSFESEFPKIVKEINFLGENILHFAASNKICDTVDLIIDKMILDTNIERKCKVAILLQSDKKGQLFLWPLVDSKREPVKFNNSFITIWTTIGSYFRPLEILEIMQHRDNDDKNLLLYASENNKDAVNVLWESFSTFIRTECEFDEEAKNYNLICDILVQKVLNSEQILQEEKEIFKLKWAKNKIVKIFDLDGESFQRAIQKENCFENANDFKILASCKNLELHKISWKFIFNKFKDLEKLKNIIIQNTISGNNFIHHLIRYNNSNEILKFTFKQIQEPFQNCQVQEILRSKNYEEENLLFALINRLSSAGNCSELTVYMDQSESISNALIYVINSGDKFEMIWKKLIESNDFDFLIGIIMQVNAKGQNILHRAIQLNDYKFFEIVCKLIKDFLLSNNFHVNFKQLVLQQTAQNQNLLHFTVKNDQIKFHHVLWDLLLNIFINDFENFRKLVVQEDSHNKNFLELLIFHNTVEIIKFVIGEKIASFNSDEITSIITAGGDCKLLFSAVSSNDAEKYEIVWNIYEKINLTLNSFAQTNNDEQNLIVASAGSNVKIFTMVWELFYKYSIRKCMLHFGGNKKNILHTCVERGDKALLELVLRKTIEMCKTLFNDLEYLKYLIMETFVDRSGKKCNILYNLHHCFDLDFHKMVLNIVIDYLDYFDLSLLKIIEQNVYNDSYIVSIFSNFSNISSDMLEWFKNKFNDKTKLLKLLLYTDEEGKNLIFHAIDNLDLKGLKKLLELMKDTFDDSTYFKFLENVDAQKNNIIHITITTYLKYSANDIFINTLKEIFVFVNLKVKELSQEEIKTLLRAYDSDKQNILELANKFLSLTEINEIWKNVNQFLDRSEMLNLIQPVNEETLLFSVIFHNTIEVAEFTWERIKENLDTSIFKYLEESFKNVNISKKFKQERKRKWVTDLLDKYNIEYQLT